jgi:predicted transcriptional regulator
MKRKIDDAILIKMLEEGHMQKDVAKFFKVSPAAISKRLKKIEQAVKIERNLEGLTDKEKKFCLEVASGQTKTAAALASYECGSRSSAKALGSQLTKRDDINLAISQIMNEEGIGRRHRIKTLRRHINNELDPHVSLKGVDIANKMDGIYVEKKVHVHASYQDLVKATEHAEAALECFQEELRKKYGLGPDTIEGEVIDDDEGD